MACFVPPKYLSIISALLTPLALTSAREELPLMNPIADSVEWGDLTLHLEYWMTAPPIDQKSPRARINSMKPATDGSGRLFLNDLRGPLYLIKDNQLTTYLDLREKLSALYSERGLGGGFNFFEFHPEFETNGIFYTIHTEEPGVKTPDFEGPKGIDDTAIDSVVLEWRANKPMASTFEGSFRQLMRVHFPRHIHCLQDMAFNPHAKQGDEDYGLLYVAVGEGGSMKAGQANFLNRTDSIWGTIIRIDPLGNNSPNGQYGIPDTNPWAEDGDDNTLGELWAIGFRNPHRFAWGPNGRLFATDIGEINVEEINLIEKGRNYGWPLREGTFEFQLDHNKFGLLPLPEGDEGFTYPVAQFDHKDANAISGGYVYQGNQHPLLKDQYVFGAIVQGHLFYTDATQLQLGQLGKVEKFHVSFEGKETTMSTLTDSGRVDLRLGVDHENELYVFEKNKGQIFRIQEVTLSSH